MNYSSRVKANIAGLPKDYQQMPFGRQMDYNGIIKDFKATAKTGWLGTKRKTVAAALAEFKKLYGVKEYYFVDTTTPGYKDDSIQIWYKTAAQSNPAKPPITRQWKPVLIRTNAAGQVQITEQAGVKLRAVSKQVRNPTPSAELVRIGKNGSGAENQFTQALVNLGYARRRGGLVYLTDKGKQEYKQQAGRMTNPGGGNFRVFASGDYWRVSKADADGKAVKFGGTGPSFTRYDYEEALKYANNLNKANGYPVANPNTRAKKSTGRRNPLTVSRVGVSGGHSGAYDNPLDSILAANGYTSRAGTTTRDSSGEILRTEYRNGPGDSITVVSDRRGSGRPSYAWISNGPILPAYSGVRKAETVTTLKRTLKAHLKKMGKR